MGIIDIGSNSVRLVIYQGHARAPTQFYNEKLMCGLGRGIASTGRLPEDGVRRALDALARFRVLCRTAHVGSVRVLATAAARDAANGPAFLDAAEAACGYPVELLTGEREAALSALGVISGFHAPDGVVGDLGGGSLELVEIDRAGRVGTGTTLPLGGLMLQDRSGASPKKAAKIARDELARASQLGALNGRTFYAVGGTWRALAHLDMAERGYPVHVMHGYEFDLGRTSFIRLVERAGVAVDRAMTGVSEGRRPLLVYGALVLDEIVRVGQPARIVTSALGVREGLLLEDLSPEGRAEDPLLAASSELNDLRSRDPAHAGDLIRWTDAFMASVGIDENAGERRLRHAACLLADIGWRAHPDYRGEQSLASIMNSALLAIDHPGRVYLALAIFFRHEGLSVEGVSPALLAVATPRLVAQARILAALLRVAYPISVGMQGVLPDAPLGQDGDGRVVLRLGGDRRALASERLANRLKQVGKLLGRDVAIRTD